MTQDIPFELLEIKTLWMAGKDDNNLPVIEELKVKRIFKTGANQYEHGKTVIEFEKEPYFTPLTGSRELWRGTYVKDLIPHFNPRTMISKHKLASDKRRGCFYPTRIGAQIRLQSFITPKRIRAEKEYHYALDYCLRLSEIDAGVDHAEIEQKAILDKLSNGIRRKINVGGFDADTD